MKLQIELSEEQLQLIINSLEVNFRLMMNQGSIVADLLSILPDQEKFEEKEDWDRAFERYLVARDDASNVLNALSHILYGNNNRLPDEAHRLTDLWSVLRNVQYQLHPHDGYDVRNRSPFQMSDLDLIKVKILEE